MARTVGANSKTLVEAYTTSSHMKGIWKVRLRESGIWRDEWVEVVADLMWRSLVLGEAWLSSAM
jgi:hypothetical protein